MFKGLRKDPFVCLDDITGKVESHNYVIYNPNIDSKEVRCEKLSRYINEHCGVDLTESQLDHLTCYSVDDLGSFVKDLKRIIRESK